MCRDVPRGAVSFGFCFGLGQADILKKPVIQLGKRVPLARDRSVVGKGAKEGREPERSACDRKSAELSSHVIHHYLIDCARCINALDVCGIFWFILEMNECDVFHQEL